MSELGQINAQESEVADRKLEQLPATILICFVGFFLSEKDLTIVSLEDLSDEGMSVSDIDQFSDEENQVRYNNIVLYIYVVISAFH